MEFEVPLQNKAPEILMQAYNCGITSISENVLVVPESKWA